MYGLPKQFDSAFLIGRTLEQVSFNQNQIYLHFDGDVSITIEGSFAHYQPESQSGMKVLEVPVLESDLMKLLGFSISKVLTDKEGTLGLLFANGRMLKCFDKSPQFESYQIRHGVKTIIV
jgi:hypothetical protein